MRTQAVAYTRIVPRLVERSVSRLRDRRTLLHLAWIAAILALALAARSFWVWYASVDPDEISFVADMHFYHWIAAALAAGKGYAWPLAGTNTATWPPGYPLLLAALYKPLGAHAAIAWGANIVLGALTCVALYFVARLILGEKAGIATGLLLAVFPGHVFFSSLILSEVSFTFLLVVAMLLILRIAQHSGEGDRRRLLMLGIVIGLASLVRGQGLLLIMVAGLFWWLYTADWARALQWATVVGLTCLAVIIPWSVRNYVQMGSFVPISTNDAVNLYVGHHEGANGRLQFGLVPPGTGLYEDLPPAEREVKTSNLALREGLKFMFTHPWEELRLAGLKLRAIYEDDQAALRWIHNPRDNKPLRGVRVIADIADGFYFAMLAVSGAGLVYWMRNRRSALALPLIVVGVFTVGQLLFFGDARFHFPMLPSFCLLAVAGLAWGVEYARSWAEARRIL